MGYCFYCDQPVDGETCPACGRAVWAGPADEDRPPGPDRSHVRRARPQRVAATSHRDRDRTPTRTTLLPPTAPEAPPTAGRSRRGLVAAALLVAGILATVIAVPSGFERVTAPKPPPPTTTTVTTTPLPGSTRPSYRLPFGTFVVVFGRDAWVATGGNPNNPQAFGATLDQIGTPLGMLAGGSLIAQSGEDLVLATPDGGIRPLGSPTTVADAAVSPNGLLVGIKDILGNPWLWDPSSDTFEKLSPEWYTGSLVAGTILWSPDSDLIGMQTDLDRFLLVDVTAPQTQNTADSGTLLAVGSRHVVLTDGDEVRVAPLNREPLRVDGPSVQSWPVAGATAAEMDPTGTLIAVAGTANVDQTGLWMLRLGDPAIDFVGEDPLDFTWSGDGTVLYWAHADGVSAFPRDDLVAGPGEIIGSSFGPGTRLRVYDRKLIAAPSRLLDDGSELVELRRGILFARTPDGVFSIEPKDSRTTTSIGRLGSHILRTAADTDTVELQAFDPWQGTIDGIYAAGDLTADEQVTGTAIYSNEPLQAYAETSSRRIFGLSAPGETPASLVASAGYSLGRVGRVVFAIVSGGGQIIPLALPTFESEIRPLLETRDLPGVSRFVAAVGIRTDLFVVVELTTGEHALYLIPGDSPLLGGLVLRNVPDAAQSNLLTVARFPAEFTGFRFLTPPVGHVAALAYEEADGSRFLLLEDPLSPLSRCGISPCIVATAAGRPLGFSPDGSWLVVARDGEEIAVSTVGRGEQRLDFDAPEQITWLPAP